MIFIDEMVVTESSEIVCERCSMGSCVIGVVWYSVMGEKKYISRIGHIERKKSREFVKKVYVSETEGFR